MRATNPLSFRICFLPINPKEITACATFLAAFCLFRQCSKLAFFYHTARQVQLKHFQLKEKSICRSGQKVRVVLTIGRTFLTFWSEHRRGTWGRPWRDPSKRGHCYQATKPNLSEEGRQRALRVPPRAGAGSALARKHRTRDAPRSSNILTLVI
jgi:hypothetical protein